MTSLMRLELSGLRSGGARRERAVVSEGDSLVWGVSQKM